MSVCAETNWLVDCTCTTHVVASLQRQLYKFIISLQEVILHGILETNHVNRSIVLLAHNINKLITRYDYYCVHATH